MMKCSCCGGEAICVGIIYCCSNCDREREFGPPKASDYTKEEIDQLVEQLKSEGWDMENDLCPDCKVKH